MVREHENNADSVQLELELDLSLAIKFFELNPNSHTIVTLAYFQLFVLVAEAMCWVGGWCGEHENKANSVQLELQLGLSFAKTSKIFF